MEYKTNKIFRLDELNEIIVFKESDPGIYSTNLDNLKLTEHEFELENRFGL